MTHRVCLLIVFFSVNCVFYVFLQYFDTVGWVQSCHCLGIFPRSWEFGDQLGIWGIFQAILGILVYPGNFVKYL